MKLLLVGFLGGIPAGLLGLGGGVLFIPLMVYIAKLNMKEITGVSSMAVAIVATVGSIRYSLRGYGLEPFIPYLIGGGILGALAGNQINKGLNSNSLIKIFSIVLFITAIRMNYIVVGSDVSNNSMLVYILIGFVSGILAGLLGLGGGVVRIPSLLIFAGLPSLVAQGASLITSVPTAIAAAYPKVKGSPEKIRQGFMLGGGGTFGVLIGSEIAFSLEDNSLKTIFSYFLFLVAIKMFLEKD